MLNKARRNILKYSAGFVVNSYGKVHQSITPEDFGAIGDGKTSDGGAFTKLIKYLNGQAKSKRIKVICDGNYLLAGCGVIPYAPIVNESKGGRVVGLPPIYKDFVQFECFDSKFIVPNFIDWRRTQKGGGDEDNFFVGFQFYGSESVFRGGAVHGNLSNRNVIRGNEISGFGGNEFGIVFGGSNWRMENVSVSEWGTDCVLVGSSGQLKSSVITKGRRNNLSVVPFYSDCKVEVIDCLFTHAGDWLDKERNRPGSAIQVEAGRRGFKSALKVDSSVFRNNRLKDIQLSSGSINCELRGNRFSNSVNIRPGSLGGHRIINNIFTNNAVMASIYGAAKDKPISVLGNSFNVSSYDAIRVRRSKSISIIGQKPVVILEGNIFNR